MSAGDVDRKLWSGASAEGWLVVEGCKNGAKNGLWRYFAPSGPFYKSKADALAERNPVGDTGPRAERAPAVGGWTCGEPGGGVGGGSRDRFSGVMAAAGGASGSSAEAAAAAAEAVAAAAKHDPRNLYDAGMAVEARLPEVFFRGAWWLGEIAECGPYGAQVRLPRPSTTFHEIATRLPSAAPTGLRCAFHDLPRDCRDCRVRPLWGSGAPSTAFHDPPP